VLVGYGIVARILKAVAAEARANGLKVGVLRPITLYPFPEQKHLQRLAKSARLFVVVEMSNGQMLEDVRLALNGARPVEFYEPRGRKCAVARRGSPDSGGAKRGSGAANSLAAMSPKEEQSANV
jgi:pyruvate/2-oxoacid:ferredoxin oxidoreductase alpha subunit